MAGEKKMAGIDLTSEKMKAIQETIDHILKGFEEAARSGQAPETIVLPVLPERDICEFVEGYFDGCFNRAVSFHKDRECAWVTVGSLRGIDPPAQGE